MADALLKMGFPPEQLDIIAEYGGQLTQQATTLKRSKQSWQLGLKQEHGISIIS